MAWDKPMTFGVSLSDTERPGGCGAESAMQVAFSSCKSTNTAVWALQGN
jgi:hypothetical protein